MSTRCEITVVPSNDIAFNIIYKHLNIYMYNEYIYVYVYICIYICILHLYAFIKYVHVYVCIFAEHTMENVFARNLSSQSCETKDMYM